MTPSLLPGSMLVMPTHLPCRAISHGGFAQGGGQSGVALFMVLVFLVMLTLLALAAMQGAALSERFARNALDQMLAMQAAEAALRDAERDLRGLRPGGLPCKPGTPGCRPAGERPIEGLGGAGLSYFNRDCAVAASRGQCHRSETDYFSVPVWRDPALLGNAARYGQYTAAPPLSDVAQQPRYLIEGFRRPTGHLFRITAIGYGANLHTRVMLQSIYRPGAATE